MSLTALAVGCGDSSATRDALGPGLARAHAWLLAHQDDDGAFRSRDYAVLRGGRSTTAAALRALALCRQRIGADQATDAAITAALGFLRGQRFDAPPVDYPTWTAALTLQALAALDRQQDEPELVARAIGFLREVQLVEANGWQPTDVEHGGFGLGEAVPRRPAGAELLSIAVTSAVIDGLVANGIASDDPLLVAARGFVQRCQDLCGEVGVAGGFAFTTAPEHARSKAGLDQHGRPLPIGTTTADGLRSLSVLADPRDAARRTAALEWLEDRFTAARVPGFGPQQEHLEAALRVYWLEAASRVFDGASPPGRQLLAALAARQRPDGSVVGDSAAMKEDDPLLATALAVTAWARLSARSGR